MKADNKIHTKAKPHRRSGGLPNSFNDMKNAARPVRNKKRIIIN